MAGPCRTNDRYRDDDPLDTLPSGPHAGGPTDLYPVPASHACGQTTVGPPVFVGTGTLTCEQALAVAETYFVEAEAASVRGVEFDGWVCGVNTGSGASSATSTMACVRGDDSLVMGNPS